MPSVFLKMICFFVCHGGPADHFATFAQELKNKGYCVEVYASGPALKKMEERHFEEVIAFDAENLDKEESIFLAEKLVKNCGENSTVILDMGHPFDSVLAKALSEKGIRPIGYYDNPEPYVPGGYSDRVSQVAPFVSKILFANANLAEEPFYATLSKEISFPAAEKVALGYYPLEYAQKILERRIDEKAIMRELFLKANRIEDFGQKIVVYFGGNNSEYFEKAFPSFLDFLSETQKYEDLSNTIIVLQQHPGARLHNTDRKILEQWVAKEHKSSKLPSFIISEISSESIQVLLDGALYYQTSMGPLLLWAGIPVAQVAHEIYPDLLVRSGLCQTATCGLDLSQILSSMKTQSLSEDQRLFILNRLGVRESWLDALEILISY